VEGREEVREEGESRERKGEREHGWGQLCGTVGRRRHPSTYGWELWGGDGIAPELPLEETTWGSSSQATSIRASFDRYPLGHKLYIVLGVSCYCDIVHVTSF
jgi:hypothetical protein